MPWYMNPEITCKVLERLAKRYPDSSISELRSAIDNVIELIWRKKEHFAVGSERSH